MSLEEKKLQIIHDVMHVDKEAVLSAIQSFLADQRKAQYEEKLSTPMTVKELEMRLAQSEEDIREGRVYSSQEVKKRLLG